MAKQRPIVALAFGAAALALVGAAGVLVKVQPTADSTPSKKVSPTPLEQPAPSPPTSPNLRTPPLGQSLRLLFIHHSVGGQLLADPSQPNGGGLRHLLTDAGYTVGTLTYGSRLGDKTDLFDWPTKFAVHIKELLQTEEQDRLLPEGQQNDIVVFKSCFPNNEFEGEGTEPGTPQGPHLTLANAKAALRSLLPHFQAHPNKLFVYLTAPPLAPKGWPEPIWKWLLKKALGRSAEARMVQQANLARQFNDWVADRNAGWLAGYSQNNVSVIDYYDLLTGEGASNFLLYPSGDGSDSHPSGEGQRKIAPRVLAGIQTAVARAGREGQANAKAKVAE